MTLARHGGLIVAAPVSIVPQARPILGYSRVTGEPIALMPSHSEPGRYHLTTSETCSCKGFSYRRRCGHLPAVAPGPIRVPLIAKLMA